MTASVTDRPLVTVLIPARNEATDIEGCLRSVLRQDYPPHLLEVLVVEGGSIDGTAEIARQVLDDVPLRRGIVVNSADGTTSANLNAGLARASGEVLCRVDARSRIQTGYVSRCVDLLTDRPDVVVTGGSQHAVPRDRTPRASGIARALNNRWAMGGSRYRRGAASGPTDTVYLGAFRTAELRRVGGWDERLPTNQDFELNRRLGRSGTVWFDSSLVTDYLPRRSLGALWQQYLRFGRWKVRYWRMSGDRPQPRQLVILGGALSAAVVGLVVARTPRWRLAAPVAGVTALVGVEIGGSDEPGGEIASHVFGSMAIATTSFAWVLGIVTEGVRGVRG